MRVDEETREIKRMESRERRKEDSKNDAKWSRLHRRSGGMSCWKWRYRGDFPYDSR